MIVGDAHYEDFNACSKDTLMDLIMKIYRYLFSVLVLLLYIDTYELHDFF